MRPCVCVCACSACVCVHQHHRRSIMIHVRCVRACPKMIRSGTATFDRMPALSTKVNSSVTQGMRRATLQILRALCRVADASCHNANDFVREQRWIGELNPLTRVGPERSSWHSAPFLHLLDDPKSRYPQFYHPHPPCPSIPKVQAELELCSFRMTAAYAHKSHWDCVIM